MGEYYYYFFYFRVISQISPVYYGVRSLLLKIIKHCFWAFWGSEGCEYSKTHTLYPFRRSARLFDPLKLILELFRPYTRASSQKVRKELRRDSPSHIVSTCSGPPFNVVRTCLQDEILWYSYVSYVEQNAR